MLKLWLFTPPENIHYIHSAGLIFEAEYEGEWLIEPTIKDMIKDVDKSEVLDKEAIKSPVFGIISPVTLSGGVKTLIMASHDDTRIYNLTSCGDNCAKWALELARKKDITMRLGHFMNFEESEPFEIKILNTNKIVTTQFELEEELINANIIEYERLEDNERSL